MPGSGLVVPYFISAVRKVIQVVGVPTGGLSCDVVQVCAQHIIHAEGRVVLRYVETWSIEMVALEWKQSILLPSIKLHCKSQSCDWEGLSCNHWDRPFSNSTRSTCPVQNLRNTAQTQIIILLWEQLTPCSQVSMIALTPLHSSAVLIDAMSAGPSERPEQVPTASFQVPACIWSLPMKR